MAAIIVDSVLNGLKKVPYCRCKVVESSDLNDRQLSGVIPRHMTPVFPRPFLDCSETQTRPADDYFQGSWRVLDPDYCGYEGSQAVTWTKIPCHPLIQSPQQQWELQSALFCRCCLQLIAPQRQHLFSCAKMPTLTFDFDPVQTAPPSPTCTRRWKSNAYLILIYSDILLTVYDAEGTRFIDDLPAGGPLPPTLLTLSEPHIYKLMSLKCQLKKSGCQ